jgi:hypothetical protein
MECILSKCLYQPNEEKGVMPSCSLCVYLPIPKIEFPIDGADPVFMLSCIL